MRFDIISPKQAEIFKFIGEDNNTLICDGAVRSGKTIMMAVAFIEWAMSVFSGDNFGICGKTVRSVERNVILPLLTLQSVATKYDMSYTRSLNLMTVRRGKRTNVFYLFGGKDESSYTLIQGITLAGVMFDEVALMPESFVNQANARTLSVDNAKKWFNCNPENPNHWFYKTWLEHPEKHRKLKHLHFLMSDNPGLSGEALARAKEEFKGVFYQRYVLGEWVAAEGAIYREFIEDKTPFVIDDLQAWLSVHPLMLSTIGVDFGGNGSAHAFTCTGIERGYKGIVTLAEWHLKEIISPTEVEKKFAEFAQMCYTTYGAHEAYCDSAEQVLIKGLRDTTIRQRIPVEIINAKKGPINDRIRFLCRMMASGRYHIWKGCTHTIEALSTAVWDSKHITEDVRLDNGSTNIDSLDAMEYSYEPYIEDMTYIGGRT